MQTAKTEMCRNGYGEKMKLIKGIFLLAVFVTAGFAVQDAAALPGNAYVDDDGKNWQGFKTYAEDGYDVVLKWAVYEMEDNPWASQVEFPEADNYIYAYQLFSSELSTKDIGYFGILDKNGDKITQTLMHNTRAVADGAGVIAEPNPSTEQGEWTWAEGVGFVQAGQKSSFLLFSSIYGPTRGSFEIRAPEEELPPGPEKVPEPASIVFLGLASSWFITRRTKNKHKP